MFLRGNKQTESHAFLQTFLSIILILTLLRNFEWQYSRTSIIRTSIIRISRLSGLFLWSQFGYDYLLVTIKIRSHILFKTTALKGAVKCEGFCSQRAKAALALVVSNEEYSNEFWLDQSCVVAKWISTLYGMENKEASVTNVYSRSSVQAIRSFRKRWKWRCRRHCIQNDL